MRVPADCLLISGLDISVDEGMYHEDRETIVHKSLSIGTVEDNNHTRNPDPFLLAKSLVMSGSGRAVVCAVGTHCYIHEIEKEEELKDEDELTPLQQKLANIAKQIGGWGYAVAFLVFSSLSLFLVGKIMFSSN